MDYFSLTSDFVFENLDPYKKYTVQELLDFHYQFISQFEIHPSWKNRTDLQRLHDISDVEQELERFLDIDTDNIPFYTFLTDEFIKKFVKKDKYGFISQKSLLSQHSKYLWFNIINKFPILNADNWTNNTEQKRLDDLIHILAESPVFSDEFINFGWEGYTLYDPNTNKRISTRYDWNLWLIKIVTQYGLIGQNIDDVKLFFNDKYKEKIGRNVSSSYFQKIVENNYSIKNNKIYNF